MGSKICMNGLCGATSSPVWKKGWAMKSGGFSTLCYSCGTAYENIVYCERFHLNESGWRECKFCEKPIHCGCVVSRYLHDYLDSGGIACILCLRTIGNRSSMRPIQSSGDGTPNGSAALASLSNRQSSVIGNRTTGATLDKGKLVHLSEGAEKHQPSPFLPSGNGAPPLSVVVLNQEEKALHAKEVGTAYPTGEVGTIFPHVIQNSNPSSIFAKSDNGRPAIGRKDMYDSLAQPSLSFSLSGTLGVPNSSLPVPSGVVEGREQDKVPPFKQGQRTRHILPKPSKSGLTLRPQTNKPTVLETRVARPPAEGRGRHQLLPRYWPRITDQELEQISGDLKCTIVPLFEKVLSASDAGRIGRLVLPKACAEAYFPPISQSDGVAIKIQDIKGKEWTFQFRFWPNNNSRMYVLEGVTPCIQNMQLQAGDTVTFSRLDPGGKLVIGCRKATTSVDMQENKQEAETSTVPNGLHGEMSISGANENFSMKIVEHETMANGDSSQGAMLTQEKKKSRNIGSKSRRLLMHSEDAMELRVTWEEAQELLCPPPSSKPSIVMVEDYEFEEYNEPPVFGKRTIFTARASGSQEHWGQCDSCSKWRNLPLDIRLSPKWTCFDNIWDPNRSSCSAPDEISSREMEGILRVSKDSKRRRITERTVAEEDETSGLDALATAAVLGDSVVDLGEPSSGATTRHPRHRPGCTCIVCIQPPSGKGKHKPTCICNVCLTVKRRFKTLMMRKKKRQSEREAEIAQGKELAIASPHNDRSEMGGVHGNGWGEVGERERNGMEMEVEETSKAQLDLNCDPNREEELMLAEAERMSMMSLVNVLEWPYIRQTALGSLVPPSLLPKDGNENEYCHPDEGCLGSMDMEEREDKADDEG